MANSSVICCIGCGICALLVTLVVLLLSIGTVEPIEFGIVYNSITKSVKTDEVKSGGWYLIGPFNQFFTFPATLVNVDFTEFIGANRPPLQLKDSDGQDIRLSISLQYKLRKDDIGNLYDKYQRGYEPIFISRMEDQIRKAVGQFDSEAFWTHRAEKGREIQARVNESLSDAFADCVNVQVINVQLNDIKESKIVNT